VSVNRRDYWPTAPASCLNSAAALCNAAANGHFSCSCMRG